ncbi:MAG TPA: FAD-dependent oxidoreductase [Gaiellaceae bacterium]|nr:FAD-dependent oxidoreductase [Gaiellaceae bacterium]
MTAPSVGVVGAGLLGLTAAYRLAEAGVRVSLFERAPDLGGLVGSFDFGGRPVDRFYHVVLPTDDRVLGLAEEVGLRERFRFRPTRVGFYGDGRLFSATTPMEFLRFPLFGPAGRARLATFVARCRLISDHAQLDETPLVPWLERMCGRTVTERLWKPLLDSKFDGRYDDLPATYIWARSRRMSTTRDRGGREVMGWLHGGYQTLVDELERRLRSLGCEIRSGAAVESILGGEHGVSGLVVDGEPRRFDLVLCTLTPLHAAVLLPKALAHHAGADRFRYLGVVCLLLRARRSVSPYYHLNITDRRVPLTTVVETTHVVDPEHVGGHLVYAARYVEPEHEDHRRPTEDIAAEYLGHVRTIFPDLADEDVLGAVVQRARVTEPVHLVGGAANLPEHFPVPGLALASTAHIYPEISSGQAVTGVAERVVPGILERLPAVREVAA